MDTVKVGEVWVDTLAVDPTVEIVLSIDYEDEQAQVARFVAPMGTVVCEHARNEINREDWENDGLICVTSAEELIRMAKDERCEKMY
ncbi:hypothetical protein [Vibrio phage VP41s3]|nr:hypothetical protein [Vibrio phage VP41s3]